MASAPAVCGMPSYKYDFIGHVYSMLAGKKLLVKECDAKAKFDPPTMFIASSPGLEDKFSKLSTSIIQDHRDFCSM